MKPREGSAEARKNRRRIRPAEIVLAVAGLLLATLGLVLATHWPSEPSPPVGSAEAQARAWDAAIKASDPAIATSETTASDPAAGEKGGIASTKVILREGKVPTQDLMTNVYDAVMASTQADWKNERMYLNFAYSEHKYDYLSIADACTSLGIQDRTQGSVYCAGDVDFGIVPDPNLGGLPGTPNALGAADSILSQQKSWTDAAAASGPDVGSVAITFPNYDPSLAYVNVTLRPGAMLSYDAIRRVTEALQGSTMAQGDGVRARMYFFSAGTPDTALPVAGAFAAAGVVNPITGEAYEDDANHVTVTLTSTQVTGS